CPRAERWGATWGGRGRSPARAAPSSADRRDQAAPPSLRPYATAGPTCNAARVAIGKAHGRDRRVSRGHTLAHRAGRGEADAAVRASGGFRLRSRGGGVA